ncbi:pseudouridine synthase [Paludisphaera mucosa]|uniref:Pseudouridine synthase n=1 Tax=Paludisphaera mucosa TaxID=3030827 RepID=A0ABT6FES3_9BACT|nr:pseudouridine synthase [Paludisphaera mucosa]MDG3006075.1 pseudouridine synthase [Paludisphaera mucosa]
MAERRSYQGGGKGRPPRKEGGGPKPPGGPLRSLSGSGPKPKRFGPGGKPGRPGAGPGQGQGPPPGGYSDRKGPRRPSGDLTPRKPRRDQVASSPENEKGERLQKVLAQAGLGSRRACEEYILQGRVTVDGKTVKELGARVHPGQAAIAVDGEKLKAERHVYYAVNKPKGYVSTNEDPAGRPRVVDLLPEVPERVYTVGRLDEESTGLMLLTNDGDLANRLAHPRYGVEKVYRAVVAGTPSPDILARLTDGVWLSDGKVRAKRTRIVSSQGEATVLELVLAEGKKREIRRMLAKFGHKVMTLTRVSIGPISLKGLLVGEARPLSRTEVDMLRKVASGVNISPPRDLSSDARPRGRSPRPNQHQGQDRYQGPGRPPGRPRPVGDRYPNPSLAQGQEVDIEALGPPPSQRRGGPPQGRPDGPRGAKPERSPSGVRPPRPHFDEGTEGPPPRPAGAGRQGYRPEGGPPSRPQGNRPDGPPPRRQAYRPEGGPPSRPQGYRSEGPPPRPQGYRPAGGPPQRPQAYRPDGPPQGPRPGGPVGRPEGPPPSQRPARPAAGTRPGPSGPRPPGAIRIPRPAGPPPSKRPPVDSGPPPTSEPKGRRIIGLDPQVYRATNDASGPAPPSKRPMPKRRPLRKAAGVKRKRPGDEA